MSSRDEQIDRQLAAITATTSKVATYAGRRGTLALVSIGGREVALPFRALQLPPPGHPVQVETRNGQTVVTGPARPLPTSGTVAATGDLVDVVTWGGQGNSTRYRLPVAPGYVAAVGDDVEIRWTANGGLVTGLVPVPAAPVTVAPPRARELQEFHPDPFTATWSGSSTGTADVHATDGATGGWGYGTKIFDTIPDTAIITAASIYLPARRLAGAAPQLRLHPFTRQPAGALVFLGTAVPLTGTRSGWVPIPTALVDFLKANAGGIGFEHGGDNVYRGLQGDQYSGALDITWSA